jgi:hypothetical protein
MNRPYVGDNTRGLTQDDTLSKTPGCPLPHEVFGTKDVSRSGLVLGEQIQPRKRWTRGGWPFNPNKAQLSDYRIDMEAVEGAQLPPFSMVDQFGETVELYDLAGTGRDTIIAIGSPLCRSCKSLANFISTGNMDDLRYGPGPYEGEWVRWWSPKYAPLYEMVPDGTVRWLTVISWPASWSVEDPISETHCTDWVRRSPHQKMPVLADTDSAFATYIGRPGSPTLLRVDDQIVMVANSNWHTFSDGFSE